MIIILILPYNATYNVCLCIITGNYSHFVYDKRAFLINRQLWCGEDRMKPMIILLAAASFAALYASFREGVNPLNMQNNNKCINY